MTVRRRLLLVLVAFMALIVASAAALTITVRERGDRSEDMREYAVTAEDVARLEAAYTDLENGERGFIITGESDLLAPYTAGLETVTEIGAAVRARHGTDSELVDALETAEMTGERWRTSAAEPAIELRRTQGREAAEALVGSGPGDALFGQLRDELSRLDALANQRFEEAARDDARLRRRQITILIVTLALMLGLAAFTVAAMRRWITDPLAAITSAARAVRRGDLRRSIPIVGPADVKELGEAVNTMRQRMVAEIDRADRARAAIEQSASIVLQVQAVLTTEPRDIPDGWTAAAGLEAAEGLVAGDCYDIFTLGTRELAVLVLDIAGHGAAAALTALRCREIVRAAVRSEGEPGQAFAALGQLTDDMEEDLFVTGFVAVIDHESGHVRWANAGHPPALLRHGLELIELPPTGPVVGAFPGEWTSQRATIHPGGQLVVYTDGIPEARRSADFFGFDRLAELVVSAPLKATTLVADLLQAAKVHADGRLVDDATVVVVARDEPPEPSELPDETEMPSAR